MSVMEQEPVRSRRSFTDEFKRDAVALVIDEGRRVIDVARSLGPSRESESSSTPRINIAAAVISRAPSLFATATPFDLISLTAGRKASMPLRSINSCWSLMMSGVKKKVTPPGRARSVSARRDVAPPGAVLDASRPTVAKCQRGTRQNLSPCRRRGVPSLRRDTDPPIATCS